MKKSDKIRSRHTLAQLLKVLEWANASDADESDRPSCYADQRNLYGHVSEAIACILQAEIGIDYHKIPDCNYGGNACWFDDLMIAIDHYYPHLPAEGTEVLLFNGSNTIPCIVTGLDENLARVIDHDGVEYDAWNFERCGDHVGASSYTRV